MVLIKKVVTINKQQFITTNNKALLGVIIPAGISRLLVLGFAKSNLRSTNLLNAMAALLAKTIQARTAIKSCQDIAPLLA